MKTKILETLNPKQKESVEFKEGPVLVLAGAGSGKTRVLTARIANLINQGVPLSNILAVTFTNKAANEMKARIARDLENLEKKISLRDLWIGTFHGICNRLLRQEIKHLEINKLTWSSNFIIFDSSDSLSLLKECLKSLDIDEKRSPAKNFQYKISELKNKGLLPKDYESEVKDHEDKRLFSVYDLYQEKLNFNNALDFDDLLIYTSKILEDNYQLQEYYHSRFRHILVDEFQDTNETQYRLLKLFATRKDRDVKHLNPGDWSKRSFCAVGDIDQSIYSWRGANYRLALDFQKDFPESKLIKLEYNYRSCQPIINLANSIIKNNKKRIDKNLICTKGKGEKITLFEGNNESEETNFILEEIRKNQKEHEYKLKEIAILYRTNAQSRFLEEALVKNNINYRLVGSIKFYERMEIKDLISYLRVINNSRDFNSLKRIINTPRRGIGPSSLARLEKRADELSMSLYDVLSDLLDSCNLSTQATKAIHGFIDLIEEFKKESWQRSIPELIKIILEDTGYLEALKKLETEEANGRIENLYELIGVAREFEEERLKAIKLENSDFRLEDFSKEKLRIFREDNLSEFLAQASLLGSETKENPDLDAVTLLTVHSSKGLEFPVVFVVGLEEGVFPHAQALRSEFNSKERIEEERRLAYVAFTRAEEKLYLTYCNNRSIWGMRQEFSKSRFLEEVLSDQASEIKLYWGSNLSEIKQERNPRISKRDSQDNQKIKKLEIGTEVLHPKFGKGIILTEFEGKSQLFYSVEFKENNFGKKLLALESLSPS